MGLVDTKQALYFFFVIHPKFVACNQTTVTTLLSLWTPVHGSSLIYWSHLFRHLCIAVGLGNSSFGQGWRMRKPSLGCQAYNLIFSKVVFRFWLVEILSIGAEGFLFQEGEVCWEAGRIPSPWVYLRHVSSYSWVAWEGTRPGCVSLSFLCLLNFLLCLLGMHILWSQGLSFIVSSHSASAAWPWLLLGYSAI